MKKKNIQTSFFLGFNDKILIIYPSWKKKRLIGLKGCDLNENTDDGYKLTETVT